jgi:hypothetical protein
MKLVLVSKHIRSLLKTMMTMLSLKLANKKLIQTFQLCELCQPTIILESLAEFRHPGSDFHSIYQYCNSVQTWRSGKQAACMEPLPLH